VGCELAQAFARLGSRVTIVQRAGQFLPREDRDAADLLADVFGREGIDVHLGATVERVEAAGGGVKVLHVNGERGAVRVEADALLVATGRTPNVERLGLDTAGVRCGPRGVIVDDFLRTSNPRVYAAGDVCLPWRFTHMADASARVAIQNALLPLPGPFRKRVSHLVVPWCTYTDPEIAHVGLYERQAKEKGIQTETVRVPLAEVDRAVTDGETDGFLKVLVRKGSDRILGATLVARHAGEVISEITTAMVGGLGLKRLAEVIHPYPTQAEVVRIAADEYYRRSFGPRTKGLVRRWLRWRR
jgi:pyruvate/2-oxoglutarate dehydrogenase complex dihydrolipoamide dehydrogenase (E3) component